jgi:TolB protein
MKVSSKIKTFTSHQTLAPLLLLAGVTVFAATRLSAADAPQLAIYLMNVDGTDLRQLVQVAGQRWHASPSWSNDGKRVLFHAHPTDASTADSHIYVARDDGSDLQDLGVGGFATWSPDNKQILFSIAEKNPDSSVVGVWVMNADGKGRQWLFAGISPVYAPDGSRILYVSSHEGNQSIYAYDVIDGTQKKLLQEPYQKRPGAARWSADGKRIAFVDERNGKSELIVIDAAGSEKSQTMRLRGMIGGPAAWGPNANLLIWSRENQPSDPQRLHTVIPDGDDSPVLLPNQDVGTLNFDPDWSADGLRVVFASDRGK